MLLSFSHVHRIGPQPRLATGHPVARELPRGGQGQEADPLEPLRLAARADRRLQGAAQRRHRHSQGAGCHHHHPLAAARALSPDTATSSLGEQLALGIVDEDELYSALDWLTVRQPAIEAALAKRHFTGGALVLYDVSSSYMEGRCCPLAQFGYSRAGKRGKLQIVYGLLCARDGCPVAIEVFAGSTADPTTLTSQVTKLKERFALDHVVLVGDRGT